MICDERPASPIRLTPQSNGVFRWTTVLPAAKRCRWSLRAFTDNGSLEVHVQATLGKPPRPIKRGFLMPKAEQWRRQIRTRKSTMRLVRTAFETEATLISQKITTLRVPAAGIVARVKDRPWPKADVGVELGETLVTLVLNRPMSPLSIPPPWRANKAVKRHELVNILRLHAPHAGRVMRVRAHPGKKVPANAAIADLADGSQLLCRVDVAESESEQLHNPTLVLQRSPEQTVVITTSITIDHKEHALKASVANEDGRWEIGQTVPAVVEYGPGVSALVVPNRAVVHAGNRKICFVQLSAQRFEKRVVTLGKVSVDSTEVIDGLEVGERVVIDGLAAVRAALGRQDPTR